jgi:hypothetical protein
MNTASKCDVIRRIGNWRCYSAHSLLQRSIVATGADFTFRPLISWYPVDRRLGRAPTPMDAVENVFPAAKSNPG